MMPKPNPAAGAAGMPDTKSAPRNLMLRVMSSAVLAPVAIGIAYLGGWPFAVFWTAAAAAVWWEWTRIVHPAGHQGVLITGLCTLIFQALLLAIDRADVAILITALGALAAAIISARNAVWTGAGIVYASVMMIAPVMIRGDDRAGFFAIAFVFAVVWATDIVAYFTGRAIGGPKLASSISPNKTWSGAIGGIIAAIAAAAAFASLTNARPFLFAAI